MPNIDTCSAHEVLLPTGPGPQYVGTPAGGGGRRPVGFATNGNFYTANDLQPRAQAAVVVDGRITFVGDSPDALRRASPGARRLDLHGTTVLPGLTDAHAHLGDIGRRELTFFPGGNEKPRGAAKQAARACRGRSRRQLTERWRMDRVALVARCLPNPTGPGQRRSQPGGGAATGLGPKRWSPTAWLCNGPESIETQPPRPQGAILKDAAGEPTGMLIDNAMALVERLVPPTEAEAVQALEVGARRSVAVGWTQLQIAGNTFQEVDRLCRLYAAGKIQLRLYDAIYGPSADADRLLAAGPDPQHCGGKLAVRGIKLYIDGALGSRGRRTAQTLQRLFVGPGDYWSISRRRCCRC